MKAISCALLLLLLSVVARADDGHALAIDRAHSQVTVAVKATVDSFVAKLQNYEADVRVDAGAARVVSAVMRFKFADVTTGKADRDAQMNTWQQTDKFPDGAFTLASLVPAGDGRLTVRGRLRLHGVERELTFPAAVTTDHTLFSIDAEAPFDTREFGLPVIRKFALLKVDPVVTVRVHLQGSLATP